MSTVKVKICGMKFPENIADVSALSPDYMGFIFYPKSKRFVAELSTPKLNQNIKKTGVFVNTAISEIQERITTFVLQAIQLHGSESPADCLILRETGIEIIKAFGISEDFDWTILNDYVDVVDYFLFDTKTSDHGGSGRTFDWQLLSGYHIDKPYFLSGGLDATNIREAMATNDTRLYALDLNSKFEIEPGLKDISLLKQAFQHIRHEQVPGK